MVCSLVMTKFYFFNFSFNSFSFFQTELFFLFFFKLLLKKIVLLHFLLIEFVHFFRVLLMFFDHLSDFFPVLLGLLSEFGHFIESEIGIGEGTVSFLFSDFVLIKFHFSQLVNHHLFLLYKAFVLPVEKLTF